MSIHHSVALLILALVLSATAGCGGGGEDNTEEFVVHDLGPGTGLDAFQIVTWSPNAEDELTTWGQLRVSPEKLEKETGMRGGWLNVATDRGWVVVNLPIPPADGPFSVYFDLGLDTPEPLQQVALDARLSNRGFGKLADHTAKVQLYPVDHRILNARGWGPESEPFPAPPPFSLPLIAEVRTPLSVTVWTQMLTNEQCAQDQCAPMAAANAFQYLENMGVWTVPHVHDLGLGGDTTLVGQLDTWTGRSFSSRSVGSGIGSLALIDGAFAYISDNSLTGTLTHRHQDQGWGSGLPTSNYSAHGSTSVYDGAMPTWTWIRDRVRDGCGVVAGYSHSFGGGGHMVRVTGAMVDSAGDEWMRYTHDRWQTGSDATDSMGLETVWVHLSDLDSDGILNMGTAGSELRIVFASCP